MFLHLVAIDAIGKFVDRGVVVEVSTIPEPPEGVSLPLVTVCPSEDDGLVTLRCYSPLKTMLSDSGWKRLPNNKSFFPYTRPALCLSNNTVQGIVNLTS